MRGLILLGALVFSACDGTDGLVLKSGDGGVDGAVSDLAGNAGCPSDISAADGTSCSEEGKSCGGERCTSVCEFCNIIRCANGKWQHIEAFPANCDKFCHLGSTPVSCTPGGTDVCGPKGATCDAVTSQCVCSQKVCTPGQDQTCNDNVSRSSIAGSCNAFGACECGPGTEWNPDSGRCATLTCPVSAPTSGGSCAHVGQQCAYLPNTTCVCQSDSRWSCAL